MGRKKVQEHKPKYNVMQNVWFMIKLAWQRKEKKVLFTAILLVVLGVLLNIINLIVTPTIIDKVEKHVNILSLISTIVVFVSSLVIVNGLNTYVTQNTLFGRVQLRSELIGLLNDKMCTTSYPNLENEDFHKLSEQASIQCSSNQEATEAIWKTLVNVMINVICFILYTILFSMLTPTLLIFIVLTTLISFFLNNYLNLYKYKHKEEEAEELKKILYVNNVANSVSYAKDIRIFGLKQWLTEIYDKSLD